MAVSANSKRSRLTSLLAVGVVYLLLGGLLYWAVTQPLTRLSGTVAALVVLGGWLPAYLYLRWAEIRGNPVFWVSHGLALALTVLAAFFIWPAAVEWDEAIEQAASRPNNAIGIGGALLIYLVLNQSIHGMLVRLYSGVSDSLERRLVKHQPSDNPRGR